MTLAHALILCRCCAIRHKREDDQRSIADAFRWHRVQKSGDPFRRIWVAVALKPRIKRRISNAYPSRRLSARHVVEPKKFTQALDNRCSLLH